jgi:hypothetical protein
MLPVDGSTAPDASSTAFCDGKTAALLCDDFEGARPAPGKLAPTGSSAGATMTIVPRVPREAGNANMARVTIPMQGTTPVSAAYGGGFSGTKAVAIEVDINVEKSGLPPGTEDYSQPIVLLISGQSVLYIASTGTSFQIQEQYYVGGTVRYAYGPKTAFPVGWTRVRLELDTVAKKARMVVGGFPLMYDLVGTDWPPVNEVVLGVNSSRNRPNETSIAFDSLIVQSL